MAKGGARPGAGRKKGQVNKMTAKAREIAAATGLLPHEFLLTVMRGGKPAQELFGKDVPITPEMRISAAEKAAPFYAPRLSAVGVKQNTAADPWAELLKMVHESERKPPSSPA